MKAKIIILDGRSIPHPEDNAMVCAMYSRSPDTVTNHLAEVAKSGSGKFMDKYYTGYGHKSIGDLGNIQIHLEGVSQIAAHWFERDTLGNYQEASTRYLDFTEQGTYDNKGIEWLNLYNKILPELINEVKLVYPRSMYPDTTDTVYNNSINAHAFDIARGFLPISARTNMVWSTTLSRCKETLRELMTNPLNEVRNLCFQIHSNLLIEYPNSFSANDLSGIDIHEPTSMKNDSTFTDKTSFGLHPTYTYTSKSEFPLPEFSVINNKLRFSLSDSDMKSTVHEFKGSIDFGSYRDLHRHRKGFRTTPYRNMFHSKIHPWYTNALNYYSSLTGNFDLANYADEALDLMYTIKKQSTSAHSPDSVYELPLGAIVDYTLMYAIDQLYYVGKIRSTQHVHQTLRPLATTMLHKLQKMIDDELSSHNLKEMYTEDGYFCRCIELDVIMTDINTHLENNNCTASNVHTIISGSKEAYPFSLDRGKQTITKKV